MKKYKQLVLFVVPAILFSLSSCNFHCVDAEGDIITDNRIVESFNGIDISIPANVKIIMGDEPGITITAPESYVNAITTSITRNKLIILGDVCKADNSDIVIEITTTAIEVVKVSGSANVYSDFHIKSENLELKVNGSGSISLSIFTNDVDGDINGSGNIILNGTCQNIDVDINGSGDFKSLGLKSFRARVKISGSGKASVVAHNKLHATVHGSGEISYSGNPEISINISGSGEVNKVN
ncbi:MAG: DUF2807 domain-containing protein [Bacteroidetes bacterium]|nr:DUF2807 domain-containing protein [Bacteroidota bacterium]